MKCIMCSKETNNVDQICDKCLVKKTKAEHKQAKARLRKSKFVQVDFENEPEYGKNVYPTGMRSGIICLISAIVAMLFALFILPGFIFGVLAFVEGIITLVDVIKNNRRGHKRMLPLAFAIVGICGSFVAFLITLLSIISIIATIAAGTVTGILAILISIFAFMY